MDIIYGVKILLIQGGKFMRSDEIRRLIGKSPLGNDISTNSRANNNCLITGISGMGKTYLNYNMILQDYFNGIPVIIIDAANSFKISEMPDIFKKEVSEDIVIYNSIDDILPVNTFSAKEYYDDGKKRTETSNEIADRVASLMKKNCRLGTRQYPAVIKVIKSMLDEYSLNSEVKSLTFERLIERLSINDKYSAQAADKLYPIIINVRFSDTLNDIWYDIMDRTNPKITIFQLSSLSETAAHFVIDIILDDMFKHLQLCGNSDLPVTLVLDELQRINLKPGSIFGRILVESRKYGLSTICTTQFYQNLNSTIIRQLEQASTKIYFKPTDRDLKYLVKLLKTNSDFNWKEVIKRIDRKMCIVETNQYYNSELDKLVYVYPMEKLMEVIGYNVCMISDSSGK